MSDKSKNTTLHGITQEQIVRLQQLALGLLGKRSISLLVRYIADNGHISDTGLIVNKPPVEGEMHS